MKFLTALHRYLTVEKSRRITRITLAHAVALTSFTLTVCRLRFLLPGPTLGIVKRTG